ncbi:amidohydrolase family protein [bacterium]|nr:amidohydrolase family protein [bacterium]
MANKKILILIPITMMLLGCKSEMLDSNAGELSPAAKSLIRDALAPFAADTLIDHHTHIVGLGGSGSGIEINSDMRSVTHPIKLTRFSYFMDAAGVTEDAKADEEYLNKLMLQIAGFPVHFKILGLALDRHYLENGEIDEDETEIYVPNQYLFDLSRLFPEHILPAISVHPYRKEAVSELEFGAAQGARVVKWIPNAQGIDPSSEQCDPFYEAMVRLDMVLLTHAGVEYAVDSGGRQHLGNPLLLRRALDAGVKVIVAHCAVAGEALDIDDPEQGKQDNFSLFLRLFDDPQYEDLLFADISAMTLLNQIGEPLKVMLSRSDLHHRLLYASDYPLPAVTILNSNAALSHLDYLDADIVPALNEIQNRNPLLYYLVLMRSIKHPESGDQFSEDLFRNKIP